MIDLEIHTNDPKAKLACLRYWNLNQDDEFTENVPLLASEYGMNMSAFIRFVNKHSTAYHKEVVCNECGKRYVYASRSDYKQTHLPVKGFYTCDSCKERRSAKTHQIDQERKIMLRHKAYSNFLSTHFTATEGVLITPEQMSFKQAVYLLSFVHHTASENYEIAFPLADNIRPLAPTSNHIQAIITNLVSSEFITLHPTTDTGVITIEGEQLIDFDIERVRWQFTLGATSSQRDKIIHSLETTLRSDDWPQHWKGELSALCREVTLQECLEYIYYKFESSYLEVINPYIGEKTTRIIHVGLEHFSVSQMFRFILNAFTQTKIRKEHQPPMLHYQVLAVFNEQLRAEVEKALSSGEDIKGVQRTSKYRESTISHVLFRSILQKKGGGFDEVFQKTAN